MGSNSVLLSSQALLSGSEFVCRATVIWICEDPIFEHLSVSRATGRLDQQRSAWFSTQRGKKEEKRKREGQNPLPISLRTSYRGHPRLAKLDSHDILHCRRLLYAWLIHTSRIHTSCGVSNPTTVEMLCRLSRSNTTPVYIEENTMRICLESSLASDFW